MKDHLMTYSPEAKAAAERCMSAIKELHAAMADASVIAGEELDGKALAEFRGLRRTTSRLHADMSEFVDTYTPDIVIMSGAT